jgi:acyl carrier protein
MQDDELTLVCFALALHLRIDPGAIEPFMSLEDELGLDPVDLVLVVLRLEELGEVEFPVADLEGIRTVADLADLVRAWNRAEIPEADGLAPPARSESGFRLSVSAEPPQSSVG